MEYKVFLYCVIAIVFAFMLTWNYPLVDDALGFSELSKSIRESGTYSLNGEPHLKRMPILPIISAGVSYLGFDYIHSARVATLLLGFGSFVFYYKILHIMSRSIGKKKKFFKDDIFGILMYFSPLLVLHSFFAAISESCVIFFMLGSMYFFLLARGGRNNMYYVSGLLFGIASLSKQVGISLGIAYLLYFVVGRLKMRREFLLSLVVGFTFPLFWFARNYVLSSDITGGYSENIGNNLLLKFPMHFAGLLVVLVILSGVLYTPFFVNLWKKKSKDALRMNLLFVLVMFGIIGVSAFGNFKWRYVVPAIPFMLLICYYNYLLYRRKIFRYLIVFGILINLMMIPYFVNGTVKNFADSIYETPPRWSQQGYELMKCVEWVNENAPDNSFISSRNGYMWAENFVDHVYFDYQMIYDHRPDELYFIYDYRTDASMSKMLIKNGIVDYYRNVLDEEQRLMVDDDAFYLPTQLDDFDVRFSESLNLAVSQIDGVETFYGFMRNNYEFDEVYMSPSGK
ncbi:MAG: glycosyltransferase family 39 protein, partial [Candidatus Aenigmarchaeota archaeon]|nr:glycosyltransferase family 39 protein [Candidatus Aenigmarchaeota archaeon]